MDLTKLINLYMNREVKFGHDLNMQPLECGLIDHSDDNGGQIEFWNIADKPQPTIAELEALQTQLDIIENNENIKAQIAQLEAKLPRANTEVTLNKDTRIKDSSTGQTWLEYYNEQIETLRTQLK